MKQHIRLSVSQIIRKMEKVEKHYNKLRKIRNKVKEEYGRKRV